MYFGFASKSKMRMLANGLFCSNLSYCQPLYANVWGLDHYRDGVVRFLNFTKKNYSLDQYFSDLRSRVNQLERVINGSEN